MYDGAEKVEKRSSFKLLGPWIVRKRNNINLSHTRVDKRLAKNIMYFVGVIDIIEVSMRNCIFSFFSF